MTERGVVQFVPPSTTRLSLNLRANPFQGEGAARYERKLTLPDLDRIPGDPAAPDVRVVLHVGEPGCGPVAAEAGVEPDAVGPRRAARGRAAEQGSTVAAAAVAPEWGAAAAAVAVALPPRKHPQLFLSDDVSWLAQAPCSSPGSSSFDIAALYDSSFHRSRRLRPGCVGGIPSGGCRRSRTP